MKHLNHFTRSLLWISILLYSGNLYGQCPISVSVPSGCPSVVDIMLDAQNLPPGNASCANPSDAGCATFTFNNIPADPICPAEICFIPSQGCGIAPGELCLYSSDGMGACNFITTAGNSAETCILFSVTTFSITLCREGNGPVSLNAINLSPCCEFIATCPNNTDLGTYDCNTVGNIPAFPTSQAEAAAPPYNITFGPNPCGTIMVNPSDDATPNACDGQNQTITRTVFTWDDLPGGIPGVFEPGVEESQTCTFTYNIIASTPPTVSCPLMDVNLPACTPQDMIGVLFSDWLMGFGVMGGCNPTTTDLNQFSAPPSCGGTTTVNFQATDLCGNDQCSASFSVAAAPSLSAVCPNPVTLTSPADQATVDQAFANWKAQFMPMGGCGATGDNLNAIGAPSFCGGTVTINYNVTDNCSQIDNCISTYTVQDMMAPNAICQNVTVQLDGTGNGSTSANAVDNGSNDACGIADLSLDNASFTCSDLGANTVTLTVTDNNNNVSTCSATVSVVDDIPPAPQCLNPSVVLDNVGQYTLSTAEVFAGGTDNCGTVNFQSMDLMVIDCDDAGTTVTVTVTANDGNGNTATCMAMVEVTDDAPPVPVCKHPTITFNGESEIVVPVVDLWDANTSYDNCTVLILDNPTLDQVLECDLVDSTVPVIVVLKDASGNSANCTATITVEGLPCGWTDNGGIACPGSTASFSGGAFTVNAGDCAPAFPYTADASSFAFSELCGDGEIIARVDNISDGQGFAGVMMRESEVPVAPKVSIGTNTINRVRKEVRVQPGYPAFPQSVLAYDQFWVRIQRTGNSFRAYASNDGVQWFPYIYQNIQMPSCIEVGLFAYNEKATSPITATFSNVSISGVPVGTPIAIGGGSPTSQLGQGQTMGSLQDLNQEITLFPNPTGSTLNIDLTAFFGKAIDLQVFNSLGQQVLAHQIDQVEMPIERLDLRQLENGLYHLAIRVGEKTVTERFIISR